MSIWINDGKGNFENMITKGKLFPQKEMKITAIEANQILQWWGLSDSFFGHELAKKLEDFVSQNQSLETKENDT